GSSNRVDVSCRRPLGGPAPALSAVDGTPSSRIPSRPLVRDHRGDDRRTRTLDQELIPMVSATQQTQRIRRRKQTSNGKANKRARRLVGTPAFPIHVDVAPAK
ncbi:MAG: hypothetical protein U0326_35330, partial [Polyangiales bacterium]